MVVAGFVLLRREVVGREEWAENFSWEIAGVCGQELWFGRGWTWCCDPGGGELVGHPKWGGKFQPLPFCCDFKVERPFAGKVRCYDPWIGIALQFLECGS